MKIFLISLPDSRARRQSALKKLMPLAMPFEIVDGIEVDRYSPDKLPIDPTCTWSPIKAGSVGCFMAHRRALMRIVDYDLPWAIVLEDDFCFEPNPDFGLCELPEHLPNDFDYIHIQRSLDINPHYKVLEEQPQFLRVRESPLCATGYVVSNRLAKKIVDHYRLYRKPIDHLYAELSRTGNFYQTIKPIIGVQRGLVSDIHPGQVNS